MVMKKAFLFFGLVLVTTALSAQQLYNGSFEQWSSFTNPDGWGTWATAIGQFNGVLGDSLGRLVTKDSLDHANYPNDTNSVRMTVDTITLPAQGQVTLAGFIAYGGAFYNPPPDTPAGCSLATTHIPRCLTVLFLTICLSRRLPMTTLPWW